MTESFERIVGDSERRLESVITREVSRLEGQLIAHLADRYAHQPATERYAASIQDWEKWRSSVDGWRKFVMGGIAVVGLEFTGVAVLFVQHWLK